jgi:putative ABC transport system permease protein
MNLVTIAWKSLQQRALSTTLTALSVALGVMLMVAVLVIYGVLQTAFSQNSINYDLIVGAKGSPLQLVLSTIYRVGPGKGPHIAELICAGCKTGGRWLSKVDAVAMGVAA